MALHFQFVVKTQALTLFLLMLSYRILISSSTLILTSKVGNVKLYNFDYFKLRIIKRHTLFK